MGTVFLADFARVRWWVGVVQDGKSWVRWWVGVHESRMHGFRVGTRYSYTGAPPLVMSCQATEMQPDFVALIAFHGVFGRHR